MQHVALASFMDLSREHGQARHPSCLAMVSEGPQKDHRACCQDQPDQSKATRGKSPPQKKTTIKQKLPREKNVYVYIYIYLGSMHRHMYQHLCECGLHCHTTPVGGCLLVTSGYGRMWQFRVGGSVLDWTVPCSEVPWPPQQAKATPTIPPMRGQALGHSSMSIPTSGEQGAACRFAGCASSPGGRVTQTWTLRCGRLFEISWRSRGIATTPRGFRYPIFEDPGSPNHTLVDFGTRHLTYEYLDPLVYN